MVDKFAISKQQVIRLFLTNNQTNNETKFTNTSHQKF